MRKGYPGYMKLPKLGFVTLLTDGKVETCTLEEFFLTVKWQWEVSELKMENQVLSVHFLPLLCAG